MCISMITHPRSDEDTVTVLKRWTARIDPRTLPVSILSNPTTMTRADVERLQELGADIFTVALDAATPEIFERTRGKGVQSPHSWRKYWEILMDAREVFGPQKFGAHIIVGMGETECDVLRLVQQLVDLGGHSHMFCFFPEKGSLMDHLPATPRDQWRRVQLARYLIDYRGGRVERMTLRRQGARHRLRFSRRRDRRNRRRRSRVPHLRLPGQVPRRRLGLRPAIRRLAAVEHRELSVPAEQDRSKKNQKPAEDLTVQVIQHTSAEFLGLIEDHLEGRSIRFRYCRPFTGKVPLPKAEALDDGLILLGGGPWGSAGARDVPHFERRDRARSRRAGKRQTRHRHRPGRADSRARGGRNPAEDGPGILGRDREES